MCPPDSGSFAIDSFAVSGVFNTLGNLRLKKDNAVTPITATNTCMFYAC